MLDMAECERHLPSGSALPILRLVPFLKFLRLFAPAGDAVGATLT